MLVEATYDTQIANLSKNPRVLFNNRCKDAMPCHIKITGSRLMVSLGKCCRQSAQCPKPALAHNERLPPVHLSHFILVKGGRRRLMPNNIYFRLDQPGFNNNTLKQDPEHPAWLLLERTAAVVKPPVRIIRRLPHLLVLVPVSMLTRQVAHLTS